MAEYLDPYAGHIGPFRLLDTKDIINQSDPEKVYEILVRKHGGSKRLQELAQKSEREIKALIKAALDKVQKLHDTMGDGIETTRW